MLWVEAYHKSGSDGVYGVTERKLIGPLELPLNTRWFLWDRRFLYPRMFRLSRGPVSVFPASLRIERFMWQVPLRGAPCWCKAAQERLGLSPFNSRMARERE